MHDVHFRYDLSYDEIEALDTLREAVEQAAGGDDESVQVAEETVYEARDALLTAVADPRTASDIEEALQPQSFQTYRIVDPELEDAVWVFDIFADGAYAAAAEGIDRIDYDEPPERILDLLDEAGYRYIDSR